MLRSADGGNTWTLITSANGGTLGTLSFAGLGATRMAFSTANGQNSTVVAAMAATSEGEVADALTSSTYRGLYTSTDAGLTWTYDALASGGASNATSATSVVYNAAAGLFFAAVRYNGFYSSPDGLNWTRLGTQPGSPGLLSPTACPQNYLTACPIYRGEISVVPGRNEMYVWFVSASSSGAPVDQGIWQSTNAGASWAQVSDSGIINCGDPVGCGVELGFYNLELLAVPNGATATDLYAGAINLYKCSIGVGNLTCANTPFMNLTHVYGCDPLAALAHVHPDQHALAYIIQPTGTDLMYFANDGGIYRALDGFTGLATGLCSGTNQFDDLNQNLGSMTQFVSFSQHPSDLNTLLGGTQGNGSPATATATTNLGWENVLSGDGGYNAIDPNIPTDWFTSNPDTGSGTLNIQECSSGISCDNKSFNDNVVVSSGDLGGDDGSYFFPYILDPQSETTLLVGTCRVWSGPRLGGAYSVLSPNFDTLGSGTCSGGEVNLVRALAAGGPTDASGSGSQVIYATTDGLGPNESSAPIGGNVWVTINAAPVTGVSSNFTNVTLNGPGGNSINPSQFPISAVAMDSSDPSGDTAYVTVMGFTGGPGHVWQTTSAGASWTDFTGTSANQLPDSPVNAVLVDSSAQTVYVGTDVGVFQSATAAPAWTEVGPFSNPLGGSSGFLPNAAVTALGLFNSDGQKLLRASTYGRGVWQFTLIATPDFSLTETNAFPTVNAGSTTTSGPISVASLDGFSGAVNLSCSLISGSGACSANPTSISTFPATVNVKVDATTLSSGSYQLSLQGTSGPLTNTLPVSFNVADYKLAGPTSLSVSAGSQSVATFTITPSTFYSGSVNATCNASTLSGANCTVTTANPISVSGGIAVPVVANISIPGSASLGVYNVILTAQDTSGSPNHRFTVAVTVLATNTNNFQLASTQAFPGNIDAGSQVTGKVSVTPNYSGSVNAVCDASAFSGQCSVAPGNPIQITAGIATALTLIVNIPNSAAPQPSNPYVVDMTVTDSSGQPAQTLPLPLTVVQDFAFSSPSPNTLTISPGGSVNYNFGVLPVGLSFGGVVSFSCSGAPVISLCSFSPGSVTPGNSSAAVVMTISTTAGSASLLSHPPAASLYVLWSYALWLALPSLALLATRTRHGKRARLKLPASLLGLCLLAFVLSSCGGGSNGFGGSGGQQQGTQPGTYTVTVMGTSGTVGTSGYLTHQAPSTVILVVN